MLRFGWAARSAAVCTLFCVGSYGAAQQAAPAASLELLTSDSQVAADGSVVQTAHSELRAINDAGALQISRINVPFQAGQQTLEILEAHTLKADGAKIPINLGTVFEQLPPEAAQSGMLTDMHVKVLFFPQFGAGDTAVYTIRLTTPHPRFPGQFLAGEIFPRAVAYKEVRETITAPKSINLRIENHDVEFSKKQDGNNVVYSWHYSAPTPKEVVAASVSPIDREPRFFVSSFKDYADMGRAYAALADPKIVVTPKLQVLADQVTGNETDRREQARKIYEWVVKHVRYVAIELGEGSFVPHDVDSILANGYGDCKDHDVLLQSLLRAKGIKARSVLINSGNAYTLTEAPSFVQLDHVITWVPEFGVYLDSSVSIAPFGVLPLSEYGKPIVYASASGASLSTMPVLKPGTASLHTTSTQHLAEDGTLSGKTTTTATGSYAITLRAIGLGIQALGGEKAASFQLAARGYGDATGKLMGDPPMELGPSYTVTGDFTSKGWTDSLDGKSLSMPGGLRVTAMTGDGMMGSFYGDKDQAKEPAACYSAHADEDISLELPAGYTVDAVPKDTKVSTANLTFTAHWAFANNTLAVHREFTSTIDKPLCTGPVSSATADALKTISESYNENFTIKKAGRTADGTAAAPIAGGTEDADQAVYGEAVKAADMGDLKKTKQLLTDLRASGHGLSDDLAYAIHYTLGVVYSREGQHDKAIAELSEAIRMKPDANYQLFALRGQAYSQQHKKRQAADDFGTVLKHSPENPALRQVHADLLESLGDFDGAAQDYNEIVRNKPNDVWTIMRRAELRANAHLYEAAAADYERAQKLGAAPQTVLSGLCRTLVHTNRVSEGLYQCSRALQLSEYSAPDLEARGFGNFMQRKYADAVQDFDRAAHIFPQNARYLYERGVTEKKMGNASGDKDIARAKSLDPNVANKVPAALKLQ